MESTSNSASTIAQAKFVQVFFRDCVNLSDLGCKGSSGPLLPGGFTVDGFVSLFTAVHTKIVVEAVLALFLGEFSSFLKRRSALSLGSVNYCVTVFRR